MHFFTLYVPILHSNPHPALQTLVMQLKKMRLKKTKLSRTKLKKTKLKRTKTTTKLGHRPQENQDKKDATDTVTQTDY